MRAKFNPTGTHVHRGFLKVRIDLYPDVSDKTYEIHHIQVPIYPDIEAPLNGYPGKKTWVESHEVWNPIDERFEVIPAMWVADNDEDYNKWLDGLPKVWQLNPCLCHFVKVDSDAGILELQSLKALTFDKVTATKLDDALSEDNIPEVRQIMKTKLGTGIKVSGNEAEIISTMNTRLLSVETMT